MSRPARAGIDLDGVWRFVPDTERLFGPDSLPEGEPITVPGCWEAQVPRPYRIITAWYHRTFEVPDDWRDGAILLRFGAVMYRCTVWLNGRELGSHEGGYTPFSVTAAAGAVRWGAENHLAVEVQNPLNAIAEYPALAVERVLSAEQYAPDLPLSEAPHGKQTWYSSQSGLWQSVRAERVGEAHLASLLVLPDVEGERATLRYRIAGAAGDRRVELESAVEAPDGAEASRSRHALDGETGTIQVAVPAPALWELDAPRLYHIHARLLVDGREVDRLTKRFGMRSVGTRHGAVTLNDRPVYLLGALDQDLYPDTISTPPSRDFLVEQVRRAKELGFNLLRCHIKAPDPMYLEVADEEGILLWCELPNWTRFTVGSAGRGRATLERMVETMGDHPSIVAWTIINEDWGTRLRYERRDREWLRSTYAWLKELDPTRLVVDNSACETTETPNFHLETDLADFHVYFGADNAIRWRSTISDFAARPAWLWSPHGDAAPRGDEPLILSEFGGWGLPRLDRLVEHHGHEPWWFGTGHGYYRPSGLRRRFHRSGLDRIFPTVDDLADATQWNQFDALQYQVTEMRRHPSITGYVVTELSDAYWEANGVLDALRGRKVYHDRFREINAPDFVGIATDRRDVWGGGQLTGSIVVSAFADAPASGGHVAWRLVLDSGVTTEGRLPLGTWPHRSAVEMPFAVAVPKVDRPMDARLELSLVDDADAIRSTGATRFAVLPALDPDPRRVAVHDPLAIWGLAQRVERLGHRVTGRDDAELVVSSELTADLVEHVDRGGRVVVLVRDRAALPADVDIRRRASVHLRRLPHAGWPGQRSPWEGDWVSNFNWILPDAFPRLPARALLDFAFAEVAPDHVLLGYDSVKHRDEVTAGMFVGWIHEPAALVWEFGEGEGSILLSTFRLAPESGPVASTMLDCLIQRAATGSTPAGDAARIPA